MSANVILVIVGIVLLLLALGISVWLFVLPMLFRLKPSSPLRIKVLASMAEKTGWRQISGPLFWKCVGLFLAVVCVALLSNSLFEIIFPIANTRTRCGAHAAPATPSCECQNS